MDQVNEDKNLGDAVVDRETEQGLNEMRMCADCLGRGRVDGHTCVYCKGAGRLLTYRAMMLRRERDERRAAAAPEMHRALTACRAMFLKGLKATTDVEWDELYGLVDGALESAKRPISDDPIPGQASLTE